MSLQVCASYHFHSELAASPLDCYMEPEEPGIRFLFSLRLLPLMLQGEGSIHWITVMTYLHVRHCRHCIFILASHLIPYFSGFQHLCTLHPGMWQCWKTLGVVTPGWEGHAAGVGLNTLLCGRHGVDQRWWASCEDGACRDSHGLGSLLGAWSGHDGGSECAFQIRADLAQNLWTRRMTTLSLLLLVCELGSVTLPLQLSWGLREMTWRIVRAQCCSVASVVSDCLWPHGL